jgi:hypothetical protein
VSHFDDIKFHKELITEPKKLAKIHKETKLYTKLATATFATAPIEQTK